MTKHTPGPWNAFKYIDAKSWTVAAGKSVASKIETEANARLIAAAPELLDLCKMMFERLMDPKMSALWESHEEYEIEMDIYKKILTKATGGEE